jgi:hypothetical protein
MSLKTEKIPQATEAILLEQDDGSNILSTNYWETETERSGVVLVYPRQGVLRLLMPRRYWGEELKAMQLADCVVLSRGPWPAGGTDDAVEFLFEDFSSNPFVMILARESFVGSGLPDEYPSGLRGSRWRVALWTLAGGKPEEAAFKACYWRRVKSLPCGEPMSQLGCIA